MSATVADVADVADAAGAATEVDQTRGPAGSPDLVEQGIRVTFGLVVLGAAGVRAVGRRMAGTQSAPVESTPVPASDHGVLATLPTAALGVTIAAHRRARRNVAAVLGVAGGVARATGAERIAASTSSHLAARLRPWYEAGALQRQQGVDEAGRAIEAGMGSIVDGVVGILDIGAIVERIDIGAIVDQLELSDIVVQSTGGIAATAIEGTRGTSRAADVRLQAIVDRLLRRAPASDVERVAHGVGDTEAS